MALNESILLLGGIALAASYIFFRYFTGVGRGADLYERQVEQILSSDEYKVKGKFE